MRFRDRLACATALCSLVSFAPAFAQDGDAVTLDTVVVEGDGGSGGTTGATGPVEGYVAKRTLTGAKTNTPIEEIPQSISVIGREELDDRAVQKVDEALRYTAGVTTQPFGYDTDTDWFYIRGFSANQTSLYLDGLNLYQTGFAVYTIDPFALERIEVLKGPAAVLYGGGSPGGLVNLVSKRPTGDRLRYVEGAIGDEPNGWAAFDMGDRAAPDSPWSYRVLGRIQGGETQTDYADTFRGMIAPSVRYEPDAQTRVDAYGFFQYDNLRHTNAGFLPYVGTVVDAPFGRIPRSLYTAEPDLDRFMSRQMLGGVDAEKTLDNGVTLRTNTRLSRTEREELFPITFGFTDPATGRNFLPNPVDANSRLTRSNFGHDSESVSLTTDNNATVAFDTGALNHTLLGGIDYKFYRIDQVQASGSAPAISPINPRYTNVLPPLMAPYLDDVTDLNQLGFYAQDQIRFGGGWITTLNGRYDRVWIDRDDQRAANADYDGSEGALSGRAGLGYEFASGVTPYVSVATFFNPQLGTNGRGEPVGSEDGEQFEAGVKWSPTDFDGTFTVSVFDLTRRNVVQTNPLTRLPEPLGEVSSRGFEFEGKAAVTDNIKLIGAFTYIDLTIEEDVNAALVGNRPYLIPEVTASAFADYTVLSGALEGVSFGAGLRYVGDSYADNENTRTVPDVTLVDAAIRYERDDWGLSLNANNLFDKRYVSACQGLQVCSYGQGREVIAKAHISW